MTGRLAVKVMTAAFGWGVSFGLISGLVMAAGSCGQQDTAPVMVCVDDNMRQTPCPTEWR